MTKAAAKTKTTPHAAPTQVITDPAKQIKGSQMLAPASDEFPNGIQCTAVPTVVVGSSNHPDTATLNQGYWIMDPKGEFVLILDGSNGLVFYEVMGATSPTSGSFTGVAKWGPNGAGGTQFCAQNDGNAVVYDSNWNALWGANNGGSHAEYLYVGEDGSVRLVQFNSEWTVGPYI